MKKKKYKKKGVVYSTNPNFEFNYEDEKIETLPARQQTLKIYIDKHRSGKIAVIIKDFIGHTQDLKNLSKLLKQRCGVGGSAKNGEIIIQGDVRQKVINILNEEGYNCIQVGG